MSTKQKLKRAYINVGYPKHADILSLTYRFGIQGKCASYDLILAMSDASGGVIDQDAFYYTCKINEVQDPEAYLAYCLSKGIFIEVEGGYSNRIVQKDQEAYAETLERDRKRKGAKLDSTRIPDGNEVENTGKLDLDLVNEVGSNINNKWSGKFCQVSDIEAEQLSITHSPDIVKRAVTLVDSWVLAAEDDPQEFQIRKRKAKKGVAALGSWALSKASIQLADEKRSKPKQQVDESGFGVNHLKNLELIRKYEAEEAAKKC